MRQILFVDDESRVLDGLRRLFYPLRAEWQMSFANSGSEALELMSKTEFEVVVTDIRMPGMDGTELLAEVREHHPKALRIILSGQADRDLTLKSAALAHQYLSKPCDADTLKLTIARASALKDVLGEPGLQAIVSKANSLPSVPTLYSQLLQQLESSNSSIEDVANVIIKDTAMTAKILQLVNSAFFGSRRRIADPKEAVLYLGFDTLKALTLAVKVFSRFTVSKSSHFSIDAVANHSVLTATLARKIGKPIGLTREQIEDAYLAGLLHDLGKLLLVDNLPDQYNEVLAAVEAGKSAWEAEYATFHATHAEVGTYLLWLWGLPDAVVEAVAYHHTPSSCPGPRPSPLTAVHVANALSKTTPGENPKDAGQLDEAYLQSLGLPTDLGEWQAVGDFGTRE